MEWPAHPPLEWGGGVSMTLIRGRVLEESRHVALVDTFV